jgi:nicotinamidase-related amidase
MNWRRKHMDNQNGKIALLVMDLQNGIVSRFAENTEILQPFQRAVEAARLNGIPVIFVRVGFSEGYPEVSPTNKIFSAISKAGGMTLMDSSTQIHESVQPKPDEPIITDFPNEKAHAGR